MMLWMKLTITTGLLASMALFAQANDTDMSPMSVNWSNFTALGILAMVMGLFLWRYMPHAETERTKAVTAFAESSKAMAEAFAASTEKTVTAFTGTLEKISERHDAHASAHAEAVRQLSATCAGRAAKGL